MVTALAPQNDAVTDVLAPSHDALLDFPQIIGLIRLFSRIRVPPRFLLFEMLRNVMRPILEAVLQRMHDNKHSLSEVRPTAYVGQRWPFHEIRGSRICIAHCRKNPGADG